MRYKILVSCPLGEGAAQYFDGQAGIVADVHPISDEEELARIIPGYSALIVRSNVQVTGEVLRAADQLKVIGRAGIGVDNIDLQAATRKGVAVVNAPGGNTVTTAEHATALLFAMARKIPQANASMKERRWEKKRFMGHELRAKTLGIIGMGRIGAVVASNALGIKMNVIAFDPYLDDQRAARAGVEKVGLDELASRADFISVHTPLNDDTRGLIGTELLKKVKPGVMIVNCARGPIVDPDALLVAIEDGRVSAAALDVFEVEPPPPHPLYEREEVVLTPHLGASTVEAQEAVAIEIAQNVVGYLMNSTAPNLINAPSASVEMLGAVAPFVGLAQKLGRFISQIVEWPVSEARITVCGGGGSDATDLMAAAMAKGLIEPTLAERINMVNALSVASERGIKVLSTVESGSGDFSEMVTIEVTGAKGACVVEGALVGKDEPRLVHLDGFRLDARPVGEMILVYNDDVPGVIGSVGLTLGDHGLNIAGFYNGRLDAGGEAIILVNLDTPADEKVLKALQGLEHVRKAISLSL